MIIFILLNNEFSLILIITIIDFYDNLKIWLDKIIHTLLYPIVLFGLFDLLLEN